VYPEPRNDFYASDARFAVADLTEMGDVAVDHFRKAHPEVSDEAVRALAWCYTYDYKQPQKTKPSASVLGFCGGVVCRRSEVFESCRAEMGEEYRVVQQGSTATGRDAGGPGCTLRDGGLR
jgi:hypothetical protein